MPVDEAERHALLLAMEPHIGKEATMTFARMLPPAGWDDVATRQDIHHLEQTIAHLEQKMDTRFAAIDDRSVTLETKMDTRFAAVDDRSVTLETKMDTRFAAIDDRFVTLEARLNARFEHFEGHVEALLFEQHRRLTTMLMSLFVGFGGVLIAAVSIAR